MKKGIVWKDSEIEELKAMCASGEYTNDELAEHFDRGEHALRQFMCVRGIKNIKRKERVYPVSILPERQVRKPTAILRHVTGNLVAYGDMA